jgi:hypothetical protein
MKIDAVQMQETLQLMVAQENPVCQRILSSCPSKRKYFQNRPQIGLLAIYTPLGLSPPMAQDQTLLKHRILHPDLLTLGATSVGYGSSRFFISDCT